MYQRWKSLEAGLAAMGSQAEAVLDCVEDEEDSGHPKPIDIEYLLSNVVPSVLSLSGMSKPGAFNNS
jgi:importin-9